MCGLSAFALRQHLSLERWGRRRKSPRPSSSSRSTQPSRPARNCRSTGEPRAGAAYVDGRFTMNRLEAIRCRMSVRLWALGSARFLTASGRVRELAGWRSSRSTSRRPLLEPAPVEGQRYLRIRSVAWPSGSRSQRPVGGRDRDNEAERRPTAPAAEPTSGTSAPMSAMGGRKLTVDEEEPGSAVPPGRVST